MECIYCKEEFDGRSGSRTCSTKCRTAHSRYLASVSVTKEPATVTDSVSVTHPPCTPDQLTSSCLTCTDKPTCSYLKNQTSAVPGDAEYAGVI